VLAFHHDQLFLKFEISGMKIIFILNTWTPASRLTGFLIVASDTVLRNTPVGYKSKAEEKPYFRKIETSTSSI
jgi:hypothetical protein